MDVQGVFDQARSVVIGARDSAARWIVPSNLFLSDVSIEAGLYFICGGCTEEQSRRKADQRCRCAG